MKIKYFIKRIVPFLDVNNKILSLYKKSVYWKKKNKYLSMHYSYKIYKNYNCYIASNCSIGKNTFFPHPIGIVIGEEAKIGDNCTIYQNVTIGRKNKDIPEYPTIGNNVTIYCNSTILGNVKIGDNAIIGCNSVVLRDVKEGEIVYGIVK